MRKTVSIHNGLGAGFDESGKQEMSYSAMKLRRKAIVAVNAMLELRQMMLDMLPPGTAVQLERAVDGQWHRFQGTVAASQWGIEQLPESGVIVEVELTELPKIPPEFRVRNRLVAAPWTWLRDG